MMHSGGKIIKHLIAKNGPMTTNALAEHIGTYQQQLVSKSHMKNRILSSLQGEGVLHKQVHRDADATKKLEWRWNFTNEADATLYKELK